MKASFNYNEFLNEINEELSGGTLSLNDTVQVLRNHQKGTEYAPIVDWYYSEEKMAEILAISPLDEDWEIEEKEDLKEQYDNDRLLLETMPVRSFLLELEEHNKLV